jgi:hypothetical protein
MIGGNLLKVGPVVRSPFDGPAEEKVMNVEQVKAFQRAKLPSLLGGGAMPQKRHAIAGGIRACDEPTARGFIGHRDGGGNEIRTLNIVAAFLILLPATLSARFV